jgi:hypothetical protein
MPVLVMAHAYDPIHSIDDASELVADLSDARRVDLRSILDYGLRHGEINRAVGAFLRDIAAATSEPPSGSKARSRRREGTMRMRESADARRVTRGLPGGT